MLKYKEYNNFIIIALGWLGDTILTAPLCASIKAFNPDAKITFLCSKNLADLTALIKEIDETIIYDKRGLHKGIKGYINFAKLFKNREKYDAAIVTHPHERSILCAKLTGAKEIISLPIKTPNPLNLLITKKRNFNETEIRNTYKGKFNSDYVKMLNISPLYKDLALTIPQDKKSIINKFNLPDKYIVLAPCSKAKIKDWDYNNISNFIKNSKYPVVLTGNELLSDIVFQLAKDKIDFINLCEKTTIMELAVIADNSVAVVSVDTGTMHLSYGLGKPTVCLFFTEKMINEWLPANNKNIYLLQGKRFKSEKTFVSEKEISANDVLEIIEAIGEKNEKIQTAV